jgi:two-component system CheB/CheR fusion protein
VRDDDTTHYLMKILPYHTPDNMVDGTIITFIDVTSIVQAEQHQRLLVDELNHRVKNMLAVVISMVTHTLRHARTLQEFEENFLGRLRALAPGNSLLSNEGWQTVSLTTLLLEELRPFVHPDRSKFRIEGPTVLLEPRAALSLGMAIHELTTNAVKYGALSLTDGVVDVRWCREPTSDGEQLVLEWVEHGGPPVTAPANRGFGMTLIERALKQNMSAQVDVEFAVVGVKATLRAPLPSGPSGA